VLHAVLHFASQLFRDAFLHQQPRTGRSKLVLIEQMPSTNPSTALLQIASSEDHERRFPAELEGKFLVRLRGSAANRPSNFRGAGERNLVHVRVLHKRFASGTIAGNNVHRSRRQSDFNADLRERQRRQRRELAVSGQRYFPSLARRDFSGKHQQGKIHGIIANDSAGGVTGKFLL